MQKKWYRLDTAALIFPATARRDWCNVFRVSATLKEPVDTEVLQHAVDDLRHRFPSYFVTLRKGIFWYYLEESARRVLVQNDYAYPLTFMSSRELKQNCMRVLVYKNRIAVEFFHSLTDGHGGSVFLSNLVARYLELKHGLLIPRNELIKDLLQDPPGEELEDSFLKNAAEVASGRKEEASYRLHGIREQDGFKHLTTGIVETQALLDAVHRCGVSATAFLAAVMAESIIGIQNAERQRKRQRPVKITIPVDLRRLYGSKTLRNFSLVLNIGADPRYGDYSLEELCRTIYHQLRAFATPQNMAGMIAANVQPQELTILRLAPVSLKNLVMDGVYRRSGESGGSINISNITGLSLPAEMLPYIERMEFIIGPQRSYPNNCSVMSFGGKTYINMIRNIRESELERRFFSRLVELGIAVDIESNRR
ncbi:MAG: hypothetical protein IJV40_01510 [Oscillospiraceae bacterium]|nr:hypothetical protein [Oscillospiraceae bacterium]